MTVEQNVRGDGNATAAKGGRAEVHVTNNISYQAATPVKIDSTKIENAINLLSEISTLEGIPTPGELAAGSTLPHLPNRFFVGREEELSHLAPTLCEGG
ncbi:MAG: hypothetical protein JKX94_04750, partial [Sneathiella sp.]|nr:hypothetical protein [Sneathiella sp.]